MVLLDLTPQFSKNVHQPKKLIKFWLLSKRKSVWWSAKYFKIRFFKRLNISFSKIFYLPANNLKPSSIFESPLIFLLCVLSTAVTVFVVVCFESWVGSILFFFFKKKNIFSHLYVSYLILIKVSSLYSFSCVFHEIL